jgi:hypothetical protein
MLFVMRIIGPGIWVAILSMAISALFFRRATEEDATFVFVVIMDFIVIGVAARALLRMCRNRQEWNKQKLFIGFAHDSFCHRENLIAN